jgi:peptidoglycan/LPS O-acetylase OafA/YrhL
MNSPSRIYFLDNLRAFVILLVVVLHGSMTYMAYAPSWWYVLDPQNSLFFTLLVLLIDIPIMLIMFFIAGYFALPSLSKRGSREFIKDKFVRVGIPWLVGALFLAPPTAYLIYYTRAAPITFLEFWATEFWGEGYQQSVYWFLGVLFLFFLVLSLVYTLSGRLRSAKQRPTLPSWRLFAGFWALMTLAMLLMNQIFPEADTWFRDWYILVFQPLRVPLYIGYFSLGLYAHLHGWFTKEGYRPRLALWAALAILSGLLYLGYRLFVMPAVPQTALLIQAGYAILFNAFCLSALLAGAAFFQQRVNQVTPFWSSLALSSYGIYFIHPLILYPLAYLFVPISLPLFLKAPLVITLGLLLSWAVSALILTKAPLLQRAFA